MTCPSSTNVFQDTCTYYCNRGYRLEGDRQRRCGANGTWNSEPVTCVILNCKNPTLEITNSQIVGVCNVTYGSNCTLNCSSDFRSKGNDNGKLVCKVDDEEMLAKWELVEGTFSCTDASKLLRWLFYLIITELHI